MSRRTHLHALIAAVALSAGGGVAAQAQEHPQPAAAENVLYGALVLATKTEHPLPPPDALKPTAAAMESIFGYNEFQLLGEKRKAEPARQEDWLVKSRDFFLRVDTRNAIPGGYALALQLVEQDRVIVEASVKLKRDHPLFIRGPFVGDGQLLILLTVLNR